MSSASLSHESEEAVAKPGSEKESYLKGIISQNLATGHYDEDAPDLDLDMKSLYISASFSQPNSPKHLSLSPVSMMTTSSISELSTECPEDNDTESCASLNSVQSADVYYSNHFIDDEVIIHEQKENPNPFDSIMQQHSLSNDENDNDNDNDDDNTSRRHHHHHHHHHPSRSRSQKSAQRKTGIGTGKHPHPPNKHKRTMTSSQSQRQRLSLHHRRNSKDCLNVTKLSVLVTKPIETWSVSEVAEWLKIIDCGKYKEYADRFRAKHVDGKKLFKLNRSMLQSFEVNHPSARKGILAALQRLKNKVRQVAKKQINLFAETHDYASKKKRQQHVRGLSALSASARHESDASNELYVMAVKRRSVDHDNSHAIHNGNGLYAPPSLTASVSVPHRKTSHDISEFLDEWEVKQQHHHHQQQQQHSSINFLNSRILEQTDKFTMIELESGRIVYAVTARVEKWSNTDVCSWLNSVAKGRYKRFIATFKQRNTNGFDLLNISRVQLQNTIGMMDPKMRNTLLREIKLLKLATQPNHASPKKRASMSRSSTTGQLKSSKSSPSHRKSASIGSPSMASRSSCDLTPPRPTPPPRKLGPRDIGRVRGYKGTQYKASMFNYDFMQERINYKATTAAFNRRKHQNPVQHKPTVDEIGINAEFEKPEYCEQVLSDAQRSQWLPDGPISRRNGELEKLKGVKIEKGCAVSEYGTPIGWTPIQYKYLADGKDFLAPHFWFDSSGVQFDFETLSRVLSYLPPQKLVELSKQGTPTGYESKLNYLRKLLTMVQEERDVIAKEDAAYQMLMEERRKAGRHRRNSVTQEAEADGDADADVDVEVEVEVKEPEADVEVHVVEEVEQEEGVQVTKEAENTESSPLKQKLKQTRLNLKAIVSALNESGNHSSSGSASSASEIDTDSDMDSEHKADSRLSESDQEMSSNQKRILYKKSRSRASTVFTNSMHTLNVPHQSSPQQQQQRPLSARDRNRRRFMSQESIASIQAMICNIEKQRESEHAE